MRRFKFNDFTCCDNLETVKALTEEGLGVGLLPHRVARDGVLSGKLTAYKNGPVSFGSFDQHNIYLVSSKDIEKSQSLTFFRQELFRFLKVWSGQ